MAGTFVFESGNPKHAIFASESAETGDGLSRFAILVQLILLIIELWIPMDFSDV